MNDDIRSIGEYLREVLGEIQDFDLETFASAITRLEVSAIRLNSTFGQTKERLAEIMSAYSNAIPTVTRLGGNIVDVSQTINEIALASRRNIVANETNIQKLYSASRVLGESVQTIVESFAQVGVNISKIPVQLEESADYIRSIGGNTEQIMRNVTSNMEQLNRYQFEGGIVGLTKMAAQSTMLRFNMTETFRLADKVLSPEGAIEVAAAFQRLGISAGNLVDPFQLMNQSINDPQGLQDSLINVAKQFSYFDEQSKTFRINPQGVLMLREIEQQTGVSAAELSKAAVAAGDLDRRLSAITMAGLQIEEEDKQYLANIAEMGKGGEYFVNIRDEYGKLQPKSLEQLTQQEFEKLIAEQKSGSKTLEEIARSQLTLSELVAGDVRAIHQSIVYGVSGSGFVTDFTSGLSRSLPEFTGAASGRITSRRISEETDEVFKSLINSAKKLYEGDIDLSTLEDSFLLLSDKFEGLSNKFITEAETIVKEGFKGQRNLSLVESQIIKLGEKIGVYDPNIIIENKLNDVQSLGLGKNYIQTNLLDPKNIGNRNIDGNLNKNDLDVNGTISIDINLPNDFSNLNTTQLQQFLDNLFNSTDFQTKIINLVSQKNPTKQRSSTIY